MRPIKRYSKTRRDEEMSKYVYLWFVKWFRYHGAEKVQEDPEYGAKWNKKAEEIYKKHGVELLFTGGAYGIQENAVYCLKTDKDLPALAEVQNEIYAIDPKIIDWGRTVTVTPS
jgi:hypothetical protein